MSRVQKVLQTFVKISRFSFHSQESVTSVTDKNYTVIMIPFAME